jgi:hypothetical protein
MEKNRTNRNSKESGIALVTALLITTVVLMLISSLTFLFVKGFQANVLNRNFSTVYEAANGGVEYTAGLIQTYLNGSTLADIGLIELTDGSGTPISFSATGFADILRCANQTNRAIINVKTADTNYLIRTEVRCIGTSDVPGEGGKLTFPPKPPKSGGGLGGMTSYVYYSIISDANETSTPTVIGKTEAVYRVVQ